MSQDSSGAGEFPFTRGIYPGMYRSRLWTMRQYAGFGDAAESNRRYRYLISQGAAGISVAFDLPTQMGYDSDHPMAAGEVGRVGVAVSSLADMETLFQGIPLQDISTSMTINSTAAILLAFYALTGRRQGASMAKLSGTVQNDILKEYIARGTYIYPPRQAMRIVTDVFAWAGREMPEWNTISISGYHIREAGSTAVEELAFTFANAIAYIETAIAAGLAVDDFAPRLSFFFNAHLDFLEEIAKFRAARRIYARLMRDRFGARDPRSTMLRFHAQTAGSSLTAQQPDVNIVRTAIEAMAAVLGGAQSLHTNSRDEALGLPTEESARIALRTQQIVAHETGIASTADPLGGSEAIEALTDGIEAGVTECLAEIEAMGGTLRAIESGWVQGRIQNSAYRHQREIETGERIVVGVNRFQMEGPGSIPTFRVDPSLEQAQVERLREVKASRSAAEAEHALDAVETAARGSDNLMPPILDAALAWATVGEISDRLRRVFGETAKLERPMTLDTPLTYVKGIGPGRGAMLEAKGLRTVEDLLGYVPFRYEDRSNVKTIAQLAPGEMATVIVEVRSAKLSGLKRRSLGLFEARFSDSSRAILAGKWFHGGYLANVLAEGMRLALFGKVEFDTYTGELTMLHPEMEILSGDDDEGEAALHVGRVVPIYEGGASGNIKITTRQLRVLIHRLLGEVAPLEDRMPALIRQRLKLPDLWTAVREVHFPPPDSDLRLLNNFRSPAQFRLIFEEFFWLECGVALKRNKARSMPGIAFELNERVREKVKAILPFKPTGAQKRVLGEIAQDMAAPRPMNRLLQGDVGSGKTIVAAEAAVIAIENGYQVAVLAPTEILAAQHGYNFRQVLGKAGYVSILLTGSRSAREKAQLKKLLAEGLAHVAIGTHALLQEDVEFKRLGLAIIDEQHRFGVLQRLGLVQKGVTPDVLVMTATPIPRTLAMTLYGDLDVSVIDEMPPGRKPIVTKHLTADRIEQAWSFVKRQVDEGRQAYVVYPVIEESETQAMKAAQKEHAHLATEVFPDIPVGLMHGRLGTDEKEAVMERFKQGSVKILVSTTVIEVGVDVPNASVMVIEQAERFGLAQLHQLRGRVGRGPAQSHCILVTEKMNDTARERIRTLVDSTDGFHIAEMDLKLRGPGEFFGTKQSGLPSLRVANILRDSDILVAARREAVDFVNAPPTEQDLKDAVAYIRDHWQRRYGLVTVG